MTRRNHASTHQFFSRHCLYHWVGDFVAPRHHGAGEKSLRMPAQRDFDFFRPHSYPARRPQSWLSRDRRRARLSRPLCRDSEAHGHLAHLGAHAGSRCLFGRGDSAQCRRRGQCQGIVGCSFCRQCDRAFSRPRIQRDRPGSQGDTGRPAARCPGHTDPRGGQRGPAEICRYARCRGRGRSAEAGFTARYAEDPARVGRPRLPPFQP